MGGKLDGAGVLAPAPLIRAPSVDAPFRARGNFRTVVARGRMLPSVDAPFRARGNFRTVVARGRMLPSVRPLVRQRTAAGLYGSSRTGSQITAAYSRYGVGGCRDARHRDGVQPRAHVAGGAPQTAPGRRRRATQPNFLCGEVRLEG